MHQHKPERNDKDGKQAKKAVKKTSAVSSTASSNPLSSRQNLLNLQQQQGNNFVQRLLQQPRTTLPPQIQREFDWLGLDSLQKGAEAIGEGIQEFVDTISLSGAHWPQLADLNGWGNGTSLDDLADPFKTNVGNFVNALEAAGATITIASTRRSKVRAWLMHHAWRVAHGEQPPTSDPHGTGIKWDHGSRAKTIAAAKEMSGRSGFNIAFRPALNSIHIRGQAIDMNIENVPDTWEFEHNGRTVTVHLGEPHTGQNSKLQQAAATYFNVKKLVSDPPHWSINGR